MNNQGFNELDITSFYYFFSSPINKLHDKFGDIRPVHGFIFNFIILDGKTGIEISQYLRVTKQAVSKISNSI